jgi:hypothetical protein
MTVTAALGAAPSLPPEAEPAGVLGDGWHAANQRFLSAAFARLRELLERQVARRGGAATGDPGTPAGRPGGGGRRPEGRDAERALEDVLARMPSPPALGAVGARFALTPFERDLLLLCAGVELDSALAELCAAAQGLRAGRAQASFGLALAALPDAHWSALLPTAPLRWFQLVEVSASDALTTAALRIDERLLHALLGLDYLDERLAGVVDAAAVPERGVASQRALALELGEILTRAAEPSSTPPRAVIVQLVGKDGPARLEIAAAAAASLGLRLSVLPIGALPAAPAETLALARLWTREALLSGRLLFIDCERGSPLDLAPLHRMVDRLAVPVLLGGCERLTGFSRPAVVLEVARPRPPEQRKLWLEAVAEQQRLTVPAAAGRTARADLGVLADRLAAHFDLPATTIQAACAAALGRTAPAQPVDAALWASARQQARVRLDDLAQRIDGGAGWNDLVLPEPQLATLRQIAVHVRQRMRVYETWGFAGKGGRGLGISALFAGPSGTGKTLAAEALASELELDLYRIDLSQVVSKYIGETEKNLRRVFDAAEEGGAILLFDEADALFGKRSEVKDSHDRFANIEVGYLLQRMEAYRGLAILTTNFRSAVDSAFLRRIRFLVQFPFPSAAERGEIWRRIFPRQLPTAALDLDRLTRLNVAGGTIRNIAMGAAFLAAEAGEPLGMGHLLQAARTEYAKLERPLTAVEFADWPTGTPPGPAPDGAA